MHERRRAADHGESTGCQYHARERGLLLATSIHHAMRKRVCIAHCPVYSCVDPKKNLPFCVLKVCVRQQTGKEEAATLFRNVLAHLINFAAFTLVALKTLISLITLVILALSPNPADRRQLASWQNILARGSSLFFRFG